MLRVLKALLVVFLITGLAAGAAMAGTAHVNFGGAADTSMTVGVEALGTARVPNLTGGATPATSAITYVLGQNLASGNLLSVIWNSGLAFATGNYTVCGTDNATQTKYPLANAAPGANVTGFNFQINLPTGTTYVSNSSLWLTNDSTCATGAANVYVGTAANSVGTKTVTLQIVTAGGIVVDPASSATAINVIREYTPSLTTRTMTIDFLNTKADGPGNGTRFADATSSNVLVTRGASNVLAINRTIPNYGAITAGLTVGATVSLDPANTWGGVSNAFLAPGAPNNCLTSVSNTVTSGFTGGVTLNATTTGFAGTGANSASSNVLDVCLTVDGTTSLTRRNITGSYQVTVTGAGANPFSATAGTIQTWDVNGFQAYVPLIQKNASVPTYCTITNGTTRHANVFLDILGSDAGAVSSRYDLGTLAAGLTKLYTLDANGVSSGGTVLSTLTGVSSTGAARYAAMWTVTTTQDLVTMHCMQTDPGGAKRLTPVLSSAGVTWKQ